MIQLTPEDLLLGSKNVFEIVVPPDLIYPSEQQPKSPQEMVIQLRPLSIGTFQLIMKATRQDSSLIPLLMIKESLVSPVLSLEQVKQLNLGLVNFIIDQIREISGLNGKKNTPLN